MEIKRKHKRKNIWQANYRAVHGKYCDNLVRRIEYLISLGLSDKRASQRVCVSPKTFYLWKRKGGTYRFWECNCQVTWVDPEKKKQKVFKSVEGNIGHEYDHDYTGETCAKCGAGYRLKPDFDERVGSARAQGITTVLQDFKKFTPKNWQAAKEYLLVVFNKDFGKKVVELTGPNGNPIQTMNIDLDKDSDVEAQRKFVDFMKSLNSGESISEECSSTSE